MPGFLDLYLPDQPKSPVRAESILDVSSGDGKVLTFCDPTLQASGNSTVYKGKLRIIGATVDRDAVCKITKDNLESTTQMENEATIYNTRLKGLQDSIVPIFYGFYKGSYQLEGRIIKFSCIVLEYCGSPIEVEFEELSDALKSKIVDCMVGIHKAGIQHKDFRERNVLITPGGDDVRIIDFDRASIHQCRRRLKMGIDHYEPLDGDFGCDELHFMGQLLDIWTPYFRQCAGVGFIIFLCPDVDKLVKLVMREHPGRDEDRVREEAEAVLEWYYDAYGDRFKNPDIMDPRQTDFSTFLRESYLESSFTMVAPSMPDRAHVATSRRPKVERSSRAQSSVVHYTILFDYASLELRRRHDARNAHDVRMRRSNGSDSPTASCAPHFVDDPFIHVDGTSTFQDADKVDMHQPENDRRPPWATVGSTREDSEFPVPLWNVVCKVARDNLELTSQMENEATIYNAQLQDLQHSVVPVFYGLYKGSYKRGGETIKLSCIILGNCGTPPDVELRYLPAALKSKIIDCMVDIHKAGVEHGDFSARNVLITPDGDAVHIIDFGHASTHQCRRRLKMGIDHYESAKGEFGCDELHQVGVALRIWTPYVFTCGGVTFRIFTCPDVDKVVETARKNRPDCDEDRVKKSAEIFFKRFYDMYEPRCQNPGIADPRQTDLSTFLRERYKGLELEAPEATSST
ncbi:hypothetical protein EVG20_g6230 [Dentipellis fragilis]|uniref:Uncharacterized protein n=1 Tax=Dentipellis fragilis TaxID=205917 RepID=A0A4Y9YP77_9AGAM|nr:hypothetical protein EVG20_g6230 [Dentipellis fragilis]